MNCSEFMVELTDLLDDQLDVELRRELDVHMSGCDHCKVVFVTTRKTIQIYRNHELFELEPALQERLHSAILEHCRKSGGCKPKRAPKKITS
jgi:anti-sigma factor RsiW